MMERFIPVEKNYTNDLMDGEDSLLMLESMIAMDGWVPLVIVPANGQSPIMALETNLLIILLIKVICLVKDKDLLMEKEFIQLLKFMYLKVMLLNLFTEVLIIGWFFRIELILWVY